LASSDWTNGICRPFDTTAAARVIDAFQLKNLPWGDARDGGQLASCSMTAFGFPARKLRGHATDSFGRDSCSLHRNMNGLQSAESVEKF
jgi:hypothetical protein